MNPRISIKKMKPLYSHPYPIETTVYFKDPYSNKNTEDISRGVVLEEVFLFVGIDVSSDADRSSDNSDNSLLDWLEKADENR